MKATKKVLTFIFFIAPLALLAQADSTIVQSPDGLLGLGWPIWTAILVGVEGILRVLPISGKYSILNLIGLVIAAIPNNIPKAEKQKPGSTP